MATRDIPAAVRPAPESEFEIDLDAAVTFLESLGAKALTFQTFGEGESKGDKRLARILHGTLDECADKLSDFNRRGAGVFASLNQTDREGRERSNIKRVRAVFLDLDGEPLDPVHRCRLKPHIVVESSPGRYHVYWRVKSFALDGFEDVQRAVANRFEGDSAVALLTACARLPGFFHHKGEPFQTRIIEINDLPTYTAEEILAEFPPEAKSHKPPRSRASGIVLPPGAPLVWAEEFLRHCRSVREMTLLRAYRGAFYEYTGTHYRELADEAVESEVYAFLNKAQIEDKKGYVPFNPTRSKVAEVVHALRRGTATLIRRDREVPCWLDQSDTPAENLVSCQNGILNLDTRQLMIHDPNFFTMNSLPLDFDPNAPKPQRWIKFLQELWPNDEKAEYCLQEMFGYLLANDTRQQKLFLIVGPKRGGKGTIVFVLVKLLGKDNVVFPMLRNMAGEFGRWPLIGKTLAVIADARLGSKADVHAVAEQLLSISGGDPQTINRKSQSFWTGYLGVRFFDHDQRTSHHRRCQRYLALALRPVEAGKELLWPRGPNIAKQAARGITGHSELGAGWSGLPAEARLFPDAGVVLGINAAT